MIASEFSTLRLQAYGFFWIIPGGIGLTRRLGAVWQHTRLMSEWILSLEPERRRTDGVTTSGMKTWGIP
jgi:hypothetical protein